MKVEYLGRRQPMGQETLIFWGDEIVLFSISTTKKEDKLMKVFEKELKLNVKHQFGWRYKHSWEE